MSPADESSVDGSRSATPADRPPSGTQPVGAGVAPKARAASNGKSGSLRLVAPDEPPRFTPAAARALLTLLRKAQARSTTDDHEESGR